MQQNEGDDICAVCLSDINEKDNYKLECSHVFHTDCIVNWFRSSNGNCPCCWGNTKKKVSFYGIWERPYINSRCKKLEKYSKKAGNDKLTQKVNKLTQKVEEYNNMVSERNELKKNDQYKLIMAKMNALNTKIRSKDRTIMNMKINIISNYPTIVIH